MHRTHLVKTKLIISLCLLAAPAAFAAKAGKAGKSEVVTMLADFESKDATNFIQPGSSDWMFLSDRDSYGHSIITSADTSSGEALIDTTSFDAGHDSTSKSSAKMSFVFGATRPYNSPTDTTSWDQEVYMETNTLMADTGMGGLDMTGATQFTFWAKADKPIEIRFYMPQSDIVDYTPWGTLFELTTDWKLYTVTLADKATFVQAEGGTPVPFNIASITALGFDISKGGNNTAVTSGTVWIDDLKVYGWAPSATAIRRLNGAANFAGRSVLERGNLMHITLPSVYKNVSGSVGVFALSGRNLGSSPFAKGQADVRVKLNGNFQSNGHFFYKIFPDAAR